VITIGFDALNDTTGLYGYEYDLNGRRTNLTHPSNLLPAGPNASTSYFYHLQLGSLERVRSTQGDEFTYRFDLEARVDSLTRPGGIIETYVYDEDSRLIRHDVFNNSTGQFMRSATIRYDARDKILFSGSTTGPRDTLTATFTGLGHASDGRLKSNGSASMGEPAESETRETLTYDALGNIKTTFRQTSYITAGATDTASGPNSAYTYTPGTERLRSSTIGGDAEHYTYDQSGNLEFYSLSDDDAPGELRDRASYYDAAGLLRAADARTAQFSDDSDPDDYTVVFEEYRYDALGRRVWVRARRLCEERDEGNNRWYEGLCQLSKIRRTVWDGEQELYEIQMPGWDGSPYLENDTAAVELEDLFGRDGVWPVSIDPNPYFGRVSYVHGASLNQPLSVIRAGYGNLLDTLNAQGSHTSLPTFAISPIWNERGQPVHMAFSDGSSRFCDFSRCANVTLPLMWFAYVRASGNLLPSAWHGSLMEDKQDAAGTHFRRNRYYDPQSGRFTQEDPIGIAGGLNLYGYAGGDPVNFSDPFGLCPIPPSNCLDVGLAIASTAGFVANPGLATFAAAAMDAVGAIPGVPSATAVRLLGRLGGAAHRAAVAEKAADITRRGLSPVQELLVRTPGGERARRFVDIAAQHPGTGEVLELYQVGRQTKSGLPVARERRALDDIEEAIGRRPRFIPYNRP
jgi:RHS repeat-associated protein